MSDSLQLKTLYEWFDRLMDLPLEQQQAELQHLRERGDPIALQLEGMLLLHRNQNPTQSLFTIDDLVGMVESELPWKLARDLRDLSTRLVWDDRKGCFRIGHFAILECLSVSSIGATYHAHDQQLDRDVALLLVFPRWSQQPEIQRRCLDASRAVAKIFHPHVAAILGTLHVEDVFVVVRQWIPGMNLDRWVGRREGATLEEIALLGQRIAFGLQSIHEQRVLHGDLKPSNIIIREDSLHPVITDFGTATWISTGEGTLWQGGTQGFIAPEILRGEPPSPQSDLYSLGIILRWMALDGVEREPQADDWTSAASRLIGNSSTPADSERIEAFRSLLDSLLASEPQRRPANAHGVAEQLRAWIHAESGSDDSGSSRSHGGARPLLWDRFGSRRRWIGHAVGLGVSGAVAMWVGKWARALQQNNERLFVPGTPHDMTADLFLVSPWDESTSQFSTLPNLKFESEGSETGWLSPMQPGRWGWIDLQAVTLPMHPWKVALLQVSQVRCDVDPGFAHYRIEAKSDPGGRWQTLMASSNAFGGPYGFVWDAPTVSRAVLGAPALQLRVGIMYQRSPTYRTHQAPIALLLRREHDFWKLGALYFWKNLY
jgi:serine/threonine protein kinase